MARRSDCALGLWIAAWLLAVAGSVRAQGIDLKQWTPAEAEAPRSGVLSPADQATLDGLPLTRYIQIPRRFEGKEIVVEIFLFGPRDTGADRSGASAAFSFFTFLQRGGAKPYNELADCYLQDRELILWQGTRVIRTVFSDLRRTRLSVYLPWLREQFTEPAPVPESFLKLPSEGRIWPSRRFLIRDDQIRLLWPDLPQFPVRLEGGTTLTVARYVDGRGSYWAGWLAPTAASGTAPPELPGVDGTHGGGAEGTVLRLRRGDGAYSLYLGPDRPEIGALLDRFDRLHQGGAAGGEIDPARFFRRDEYTYGDVLVGGFKIVFLVLAAAFATGALAALAIRGMKKALHWRTDLADEQVTHLRLDGLPAPGKKPETSLPDSGYNTSTGGGHGRE